MRDDQTEPATDANEITEARDARLASESTTGNVGQSGDGDGDTGVKSRHNYDDSKETGR